MAKGQSKWIRTPEDLIEKIIARCIHDSETGCWIWSGAINSRGYGELSAQLVYPDERKPMAVHRAVYRASTGLKIKGMLHHLCERRRCCNPEHLIDVNSAEHAVFHYGDRCPEGHEPNWATTSRGTRKCRTCDRLRKSRDRRDPLKASRLQDIDRRSKQRRRNRQPTD